MPGVCQVMKSLAPVLLSPAAVVAQSATIPQSLDELWSDHAAMDRSTPLEGETLREWEQDGVVCRVVRYQVGVFKGTPSRVAAFYAFPKDRAGNTKLPAILELHGGGQSASLNSVVTWARRGYACLSLNWGGNKMSIGQETWSGPQTDWGKLDATHPPQRNKANHFAGPLTPDDFTLDAVESPRNSNWYLVLVAARRALTFLEQQPEVDAARLGVRGHSMGGKLTTNLAAIDPRVKAAVPSCGGSGDLTEPETTVPGGSRTARSPLELACISDNAYLPRLACPVLWLSPTNDFHAHIDNMAWNWRALPDARLRLSISPHLNHRHTDAHALTEYLWFEQHLKAAPLPLPQTPQLSLDLAAGTPVLTLKPDAALPIQRVDLYYAIDPHALTRFWRDAAAEKHRDTWQARCPVLSVDQPLFAFANVHYATPEAYRTGPQLAGQGASDTFALSSRVLSATPAQLKAAGIKATDQAQRLIDDGSRGWHDWFLLNWNHPPLWSATTRKLKDPKWRGPDGATLCFDIQSHTDNQLVLTFTTNAWGAIHPGQPAVDYTVVKKLTASPDWQPVTVTLAELTATDPKATTPPANWQAVTEFTLSPSGTTMQNGQPVKSSGQPWQGPRALRHLRWEGGTQAPPATGTPVNPDDFKDHFDDAIRKSLEQEKKDGK